LVTDSPDERTWRHRKMMISSGFERTGPGKGKASTACQRKKTAPDCERKGTRRASQRGRYPGCENSACEAWCAPKKGKSYSHGGCTVRGSRRGEAGRFIREERRSLSEKELSIDTWKKREGVADQVGGNKSKGEGPPSEGWPQFFEKEGFSRGKDVPRGEGRGGGDSA